MRKLPKSVIERDVNNILSNKALHSLIIIISAYILLVIASVAVAVVFGMGAYYIITHVIPNFIATGIGLYAGYKFFKTISKDIKWK